MAMPARHGMTADEVATDVGGTIVGSGATMIHAVAPLDRAGGDDLSFYAHARYAAAFEAAAAGVVLIAPELRDAAGPCATRIVVAKPYDALVALLPRLYPQPTFEPGIHSTAVIASDATVAPDARVEAYAVIESGATIGARAWVGPHCFIGRGVAVGAGTRLVAHAVAYQIGRAHV